MYTGGENLTNFLQPNTILNADAPMSNYFDAFIIWGLITGQMIYSGLRFKLNETHYCKKKGSSVETEQPLTIACHMKKLKKYFLVSASHLYLRLFKVV